MKRDRYKTHIVMRGALTTAERHELIDLTDAQAVELKVEDPDGSVMHQDIFDLEDRTNDVFEMWRQKMFSLMQFGNATEWAFDITGWQQPLRVSRYLRGYRHDWHLDYVPTDASKLAMSIPLNSDFGGGVFELLGVDEIEARPGDAIVFPAFHAHRVTPITSGTRYVMLGWLTGPRFK